MTATDRDRLIEWNRTDVAFESDKCIHDLLEAQALRIPEKTAVICRDNALTYRALWEKVRRLATHLRGLGVKPETVVAIMMDRSLDMMVAMLAVLKAGGAYLPLDPAFPAERVALMLKDSDARVILTQSNYKDRLAASSATVIAVDQFEFDGEGTDSAETVASSQQASSLAYLIYTSGSTGTPKGVMVEHRNVVNFFAAMDRVVGTEAGVWLAVTSISFDISVLELLWTLSRGFTVVLQTGRNGLAATGDYSIQAQIVRHRVTHFQCTPTLARSLIRFPETLSSMKLLEKLLLGGEALPVSLANQLGETLSAEILNMYGPTETTVWSTTHKVARSSASVPIGRPVANTSIYIVDEHGALAPIGADRRDVYRRCWRNQGLLAASRPDGREICRQSIRARAPRYALPDGRPCAISRQRRDRVYRPNRSASEDSRLPYRTRRNRDGARRPSSGERSCSCCSSRSRRQPATCSIRCGQAWAKCQPAGIEDSRAKEIAGLHDSAGDKLHERDAAYTQWQDGSKSVAGSESRFSSKHRESPSTEY